MAAAVARTDAGNPGIALGATLGALAGRGRDKLTLVIEPALATLRRLGRAAHRREHRQGRPRHRARRRRAARRARRLRRRSRLRPPLASGVERLAHEHRRAARRAGGRRPPGHRPGHRRPAKGWAASSSAGSSRPRSPAPPRRQPLRRAERDRAKDSTTARVLAALRDAAGADRCGRTTAALRRRRRRSSDAASTAWRRTATSPSRPTSPRYARARRRAARISGSCIRDTTRRAVTLGYGPRYLHSTGQLHKGGPRARLLPPAGGGTSRRPPIPGAQETFGMLIDAQALGDFPVARGAGACPSCASSSATIRTPGSTRSSPRSRPSRTIAPGRDAGRI